MRIIALGNNKAVLVDDQDFEWLNQWKWQCGADGYAVRIQHLGPDPNKKGKYLTRSFRMHRLIIDAPKGMDVDHIDRNPRNNRRINLRIVTRSQNNINQLAKRGNTSGHKGVGWDKARRKWRAQIRKQGRNTCIGRYDLKQDAITAYLIVAREVYGEYLPKELQ